MDTPVIISHGTNESGQLVRVVLTQTTRKDPSLLAGIKPGTLDYLLNSTAAALAIKRSPAVKPGRVSKVYNPFL